MVAVVRRAEREKHAREAGAHEVVIGEDISPAAKFGPYHVILESVGGSLLGGTLSMLAPDGVCVLYGVSASADRIVKPTACATHTASLLLPLSRSKQNTSTHLWGIPPAEPQES